MENEEEDIAALRRFVQDNRKHLSRIRSGLQDLNVAANRQEGRFDKLASAEKPDPASQPQAKPSKAQQSSDN